MRPSRLDPERWARIDEVFDKVLDARPEDRERVLRQACGGDEDLRAEVRTLLAARKEAAERFDQPAALAIAEPEGSVDAAGGTRRVGPFRILREIGRGGMGVVYLAKDTRLGRYVALKTLPPYLGVGRDAKRRFEAEARAVSTLDHPNIATLHEIGESDEGQLYMVFAFYAGETLAARISRGPLPIIQAVEIAIGIADGLGAAHDKQIIHRDVKPSNVLLTQAGEVKLLDFSVAKVAGENLTDEGIRLGTVAYMSPEQLTSGPFDRRADLWSLGVVLYEMLTGTRPYRGRDPSSTLQAILNEPTTSAKSVRSDLPEALDGIVHKLLCKDPAGRYGSTDDLLQDLRAVLEGDRPPVVGREPPQRSSRGIRRLAVLPLTDLTADRERSHLVRGVHDAVIAELGKIRALEVISRTSVMRFRDSDGLSISEIADTLGVDAVVEGSVSDDGPDRFAITVQLVRASPERHLWAEAYRRKLAGVLDVASEVASAVASALEITLSPSEEALLAGTRPVTPEAYEAFTLGLFHLERRSSEGHDLAGKYLQRAIEIDPDFAPAYAALAEARGSAAFFGLASPDEGIPIVRSLVERALELDETLAEAHTSLGAVRYFGDWDWAGAEASLRRAIELNPSYAYAYFMLAEVLSAVGRYDEALAASERNGELERFVPFSAFGPVIVLNFMRRFEEAAEKARAGIEFFSDFWQGHWLLARSLMGLEVYDQAVAECEAAAEKSRRTPLALAALGRAYALRGDRERAERVLAELETVARSAYVSASSFAIVHSALGEIDEAFAWLNRAYDERDMALVHLADDVLFDGLRGDPRFLTLLEKMDLPPRAGPYV